MQKHSTVIQYSYSQTMVIRGNSPSTNPTSPNEIKDKFWHESTAFTSSDIPKAKWSYSILWPQFAGRNHGHEITASLQSFMYTYILTARICMLRLNVWESVNTDCRYAICPSTCRCQGRTCTITKRYFAPSPHPQIRARVGRNHGLADFSIVRTAMECGQT